MAPEPLRDPPIRAVVFDLGGTLLDVRDPIRWAEEAEAVGIPVDADALSHWYSEVERANDEAMDRIPPDERWRRMLEGALGAPPDPVRFAAFLARLNSRPRAEPLFSDVRNCLDRLRAAGLRLAVISNSRSEPHIRGMLEREGILGFFEFTLSSGTEGVAKPDPEIFHHALRRLELLPIELCYVGDLRNVDVRAARSAGWRALWLNRGGTGFSDESWEITTLSEVPGAVAQGGGR
ncbi:MAG: HAD-IA family hydrolase [Thermoplasmata archaeon]|nr:HAD-IA family hydrolase [Thermoplasmata archaeon]